MQIVPYTELAGSALLFTWGFPKLYNSEIFVQLNDPKMQTSNYVHKIKCVTSVVSESHRLDILFSNRYCGCGFGAIEFVRYILFECLWYHKVRQMNTLFTQQWRVFRRYPCFWTISRFKNRNILILINFLV